MNQSWAGTGGPSKTRLIFEEVHDDEKKPGCALRAVVVGIFLGLLASVRAHRSRKDLW